MFIETVPNRTSPPAILLRESYRDEAGKAQKRTLANLSKLPASLIAGLKGLLKGGVAMPATAGSASEEGLRIERSLPHGHVAAGLGMLRKIHLDRLLLSTAKDEASRRFCDLTGPRSSIRRGSTMSPRTTRASVAMIARANGLKLGNRRRFPVRPSFVASRHNAEARPRSGEKSVCFAACAPPQKAMQTAFGKQGAAFAALRGPSNK